jgi:glutamate-ammonia-ligase adenylyltransferase
VTESRNTDRAVPVSQYYTRLAHLLVAALTAPGPEGPLYAVDMRLRPSGNKGPVAVSLSAFQHYHQESAWTWERMALTRARVIAAPPWLRERLEQAISAILRRKPDPDRIRDDARAMRTRMLRDLPAAGPWDTKHRAGGLIEVEFITQALQLINGADHPEVLTPSTCTALRRLAVAGVLDTQDAETLMRADRLWRSVQDVLRITTDDIPRTDDLPLALVAPLLHAIQPVTDLPGFMSRLDATANAVRDIFIRLIGNPDSGV